MRWPEELVFSVVCLSLVIGAPVVLAQAIPKALIRLCLRNVATGVACYIVGRGGELIVDGTLSAAWAKTKERVTGEASEHGGKERPKYDSLSPPPALGRPLPSLTNPVYEQIKPSDLGSLSKRQPGSLANKTVTEGFLLYEAPKENSLTDPADPKPAQPLKPDPYLSVDAYRARNADKLVPPTTSLTAAQFATLQSACQKRREHETGLSFLAILGAPDFDAKLKRRMEEVVKPCISPGQY